LAAATWWSVFTFQIAPTMLNNYVILRWQLHIHQRAALPADIAPEQCFTTERMHP
jgi:hypothetical protein